MDRVFKASEERFVAFLAESREDQKRHEVEREADRRRFEREMEQRYRDEVQVTREFMRRNELVTQQMVERLEQLGEDIRAQTQAIFRMLDRFENGGDEAATP